MEEDDGGKRSFAGRLPQHRYHPGAVPAREEDFLEGGNLLGDRDLREGRPGKSESEK